MQRIEPLLVALSGLPGVGKSTIARALALEIGGVWLRIDSIEQAIKASGALRESVDDAGYLAAYAVAEDNLRLGRTVIADSVNGWSISRDAWRDVAKRVGARLLDVEVTCSDKVEHRRRIETRSSEIAGLRLPSWDAVMRHEFQDWDRDRLLVESAQRSIADCVVSIQAAI